jgi:hypothetical protein
MRRRERKNCAARGVCESAEVPAAKRGRKNAPALFYYTRGSTHARCVIIISISSNLMCARRLFYSPPTAHKRDYCVIKNAIRTHFAGKIMLDPYTEPVHQPNFSISVFLKLLVSLDVFSA